MASSSTFTCNTCSATFDSSAAQRAHMRAPWHLYNLQRRLVSQPPVGLPEWEESQAREDAAAPPARLACPTCEREYTSASAYRRHVGKHAAFASPASSDDAESEPDADADADANADADADVPLLGPTECLFCNRPSPTLAANLAHMHTLHGLFLPAPARLTDLPTLLAYLSALVCRYAECLLCGRRTASRAAAQAHMRDKGHCRIDASPGSELADFWEPEDGSGGADAADAVRAPGPLRLPSGAVLASRADSLRAGHHPPARVAASAEARRVRASEGGGGSTEARGAGRTTARVRGEQGLAGLSEQQRRALAVVEHNMMKRAAGARSAQQWAAEKVANRQKFFRPDVPGRKNG
ncbi:C2H2 type zinc-finger-domain-containing protein [Mycena rosella]|uniref:C2H2 type zinc-finger-domain-containing protein n=1 Tax=Mycena rosella TaxID=1033263 RepID=A0AAD7GQT5_MYCRO|nr:C2H2 type zinc-finger-domain-containing protein [Mycena rosella]